MTRYKMAVRFEWGYEVPVIVGFVGEGNDEEQAKYECFKQLMAYADKLKMKHPLVAISWRIIPPPDVYGLHHDTQEKLKDDWESGTKELDRWNNPWP